MKKAFSLIELSIVVAIIALLLTVGLSAGKVVKQYELKRIVAMTESYANSFRAFYDIYKVTPGDTDQGYNLFNHTDSDTNCEDERINAAKPKGCNGDNDGTVSSLGSAGDAAESILAYYHLFKADLISYNNKNDININNVSGGGGLSGCDDKSILSPGVNIPLLNIRNSGVYLVSIDSFTTTQLEVAAGAACSMGAMIQVFSPTELSALDRKYDNSVADTGLITARGASCKSGANYLVVQGEGNVCSLQYNFELDSSISNVF